MNLLQNKFECCGKRGAEDYVLVPDSCCAENCDSLKISNRTNHESGCFKVVFAKMFELNIGILVICTIGMCLMMAGTILMRDCI